MGGRFKSETTLIREFEWGRIIFCDTHSIRVEVNNPQKYAVIFHRWFTPLGFYGGNWGKFRARLAKYKTLDIYKIYKLANEWEISHEIARGEYKPK